ncbi:hypothetical protein ON010_g5714 [Phytophthora cinnamomi]|nr:hypothetical protein ON010_g5714 [Phytophthora cinnamomi]
MVAQYHVLDAEVVRQLDHVRATIIQPAEVNQYVSSNRKSLWNSNIKLLPSAPHTNLRADKESPFSVARSVELGGTAARSRSRSVANSAIPVSSNISGVINIG